MKKIFTTAVLACLMGVVAGCNKDSGSTGTSSGNSSAVTIGFINPDRIIATIGWAADGQKNLQAAQTELRRQIDEHLAPMRAAFEQKKSETFAAAKLSKEQIEVLNTRRTNRTEMEKMGMTAQQIDELLAAGAAWQNDLNTGNNIFQQYMTRQNAAVASAYQSVLNPLVREVAKSTGRSVVLLEGQVQYFDPSLDMSDDVIKEIQKRPAVTVKYPDMPKLEFTPTSGPSTQPSMGAASARP